MGIPEARLEEVSTIIMGQSPDGNTYNQEGLGNPLLNGPTEFGTTHPLCTLFTTDSKRGCRTGDLIFCVRGSTTGRMNWADQVYSLGRGVCSIRGISALETKFIRYALEFKLEALLKFAGGGTFPNLTKDTLHQFLIPYPSSRCKIAAILSAYDDLIENNVRRIKILEEMAQTVYREWFVNFRFPGHENVKMVESELGPIPEGWEVVTMGKAALNFDSKRKPLSSMQRAEIQGQYPYYGAAKVLDHIDAYIFDGKYLLVAEDGSVMTTEGFPALQFVNEKFWPNNHTHVLQGLAPISTEYLYLFLREYPIAGHITGAAQPKITQANLNRILLLRPPDPVLVKFSPIANDMMTLLDTLGKNNANLRRTRDLLLPRLISGELDVEKLDIRTGVAA